MAKLTAQGEEKIGDFVEEKIGGEIEERYKSNLANQDQGSLTGSVNTFRDGNITQVGSKNEILKFLEWGTDPHTIRARRASVLAFEWPDAPIPIQEMFEATFPTVFFKEVQHPGTEAYAHLRGAVEQVRKRG